MIFYALLAASVLQLEGLSCEGNAEVIHPPLSVASFNIQNFGEKKYRKNELLDVIIKVITRYDLICLQEIVSQKSTFLDSLLMDINEFSAPKRYAMLVSKPLGRNTTSKETYVYIYRTDRLTPLHEQIYPDPEGIFIRPPYIAHMQSLTTNSLTSFIAICVHIKPTNVAKEVNALADVYDYAQNFYKTENSVIMGDMNAACKSLRTSEWSKIALWMRPEFTWLINNSIDTSTYTSSCAYDRIIIAGEEMKNDAIFDSAKAFDFQTEYNKTEKLAREVSDHYPVEFRLKGKVPANFIEKVLVNLCIDARSKESSKELFLKLENRQKLDFDVRLYYDSKGYETRFTAYKEASNFQKLISSLEELSKKEVNASSEMVETIRYKAEHGSLFDAGSHNSVRDAKYSMGIDCDMVDNVCNLHLCRQTYFN